MFSGRDGRADAVTINSLHNDLGDETHTKVFLFPYIGEEKEQLLPLKEHIEKQSGVSFFILRT
jgi:hypothetical protein